MTVNRQNESHSDISLLESANTHRALLETVHGAVYVCDRDAVVVDFNERAVELWGREPVRGSSRERYCGSLKMFQLDGSPMPHDGCPMAEVIRTGEPIRDFQAIIERPDGSRIRFRSNLTPLRNAEGEITGAICSFEEVPEDADDSRFRALVQNASDGIFLSDSQGRYLEVNPAGCQMLGYSRNEMLRLTIADIVAAEEVERVAPEVTTVLSGRLVRSEWKFRRKDGSTFLGEVMARMLPNSQVLGFLRNITERKQTELALRRRLDELTILHRVGVICSEVSSEDDLLYRITNLIAESLYPDNCGFLLLDASENVLVTHPSFVLSDSRVSVEDKPMGVGIIGKVAQTGRTRRIADVRNEPDYLAADSRTISELCVPIKIARKVVGVLNVESDKLDAFSPLDEQLLQTVVDFVGNTLERLRGAESLLEAHRYNQQIVSSAFEGIVVLDRSLRYRVWNGFMEELTGLKAADVLGKHPREVFPLCEDSDVLAVLARALDGEAVEVSDQLHMVGTQERWTSECHAPLRDATGEIIGVLSNWRDITDRKRAEQSLQQVSQFRETIIRTAAEGICVFELKLNTTFSVWNDRMVEISGYTMAEMNAIGWLETIFSDPELQAKAKARFEQLAQGHQLHAEEWRIKRKCGRTRVVSISTSFIEQDHGQTAVIAMMQDVTDRKYAEEAVEQVESRFRMFMNNNPAAAWMKDEQGRYVYVSSAFERVARMSANQLIGKTDFELMPHELAEKVRAHDLQVLDSGQVQEFHEVLHDGESLRHGWVFKFPVEDHSGVRLVGGVGFDETARVEAEQAVRDTQQRLEQILDAADVGIWDWDLNTDQVRFSREWKRQLGYAEDEIEGRLSDWKDRVHPDDYPAALAKVRDAQDRQAADYEIEFRMRHKDGSWRWILARGLVLTDEQGEPVRMLGVHLDVNDRKRAEIIMLQQQVILEKIATGGPMGELLEEIVGFVEGAIAGSICSVLLTGDDRKLYFTAGRNVPERYRKFIDGVENGPNVGSCGTATYYGETVITENIATDPRWGNYREYPLEHGLKSCWSVPILASRQDPAQDKAARVLGTFAVYRRHPSVPTDEELETIFTAAHLAGIAIERVRSEQALKLYRALTDNASDSIEVVDPVTGRVLDVNEQACLAHGLTREEYLEMTIPQLDATINDMATWRECMAKIRQDGSLIHQGTHRRKDGSLFPAEIHARYIQLDREYVVAVVRDTTYRKQAEEELRQSEARLRTLLENLENVAVQAYEIDGTITFWNRASEKLYGYTPQQAVGSNIVDLLLEGADAEEERRLMASAVNDGEDPPASELEVRNSRGESVYIYSSRILHPRPGKSPEFFCFDVDISDRKRAESELGIRQAELLHASRLSAVGEMVAALSHEVAQPLSAIGNFAAASEQLLQSQGSLEKLGFYVRSISEQNRRCGEILQRLRDFSRRSTPQKSECDLNQLLHNSVELVSNDLLVHGVEIDFDLGLNVPTVSGDRIQLEQVVVNLLTNGRDALDGLPEERRTITVRSYVQDEMAVFEVVDQGLGLADAEIRRRLFEPFFSTKSAGMGMGLRICQTIVRDHGGQIEAIPNDTLAAGAPGATFRVHLPFHNVHDVENAEDSA